ncbi:MAG: 2'-phosphotransferase, partial [Nostocoides sp.]
NLWRFAPTPIHGDLTGDQVLAVFADEDDASSGTIKALTGWEDAKVADPADDFAALVAEADPATLETVLEAYAHVRMERPDPNLLVRARLASELGLLAELTRALTSGWDEAADAHTATLRRLDEEIHAHDVVDDDYRRTSLAPAATPRRSVPPPLMVEDDEEDDVQDDAMDRPEDDSAGEPDASEHEAIEPDAVEPDVQTPERPQT